MWTHYQSNQIMIQTNKTATSFAYAITDNFDCFFLIIQSMAKIVLSLTQMCLLLFFKQDDAFYTLVREIRKDVSILVGVWGVCVSV